LPKKEEQKGQAKQESGKTKELRITTVHVVTKDSIIKNQRQLSLLYIIDKLGPIHERTLHSIVKHIQELGAPLGYNFVKVVDGLYSLELKNDLIALTYVGFIDTDPLRRKYRTTSEGKEALEKHSVPPGVIKVLEENRENLKNLVALFDSQVDLQLRRKTERESRKTPSFRIMMR